MTERPGGPPETGPTSRQSARNFSLNKPFFLSPAPKGRRITAGFSYIQRITKSATIDMWFPDALQTELDAVMATGKTPGPEHFPAEWAAVRQFEFLQEAGNIKIYDLDPERLMRSLRDLTRNMRGGGYRVTVATIGSYSTDTKTDELAILDQRLQDRISRLLSMLFLEEQSEKMNAMLADALRTESWDYQMALPHVGVTLGAKDLFYPQTSNAATSSVKGEQSFIPAAPHRIRVVNADQWVEDNGVVDHQTERPYLRVTGNPQEAQYCVKNGVYQFSQKSAWKDVRISYRYANGKGGIPAADRKHRLARSFFDILGVLPQNHIVHETAVGLQLPQSINANQWTYIPPDGEKVFDLMRLLDNLFEPFNGTSLSKLHGREDATDEIKTTTNHMQGYGDRLRPEFDDFYQRLAQFTLH
jgi:hypothetical protein